MHLFFCLLFLWCLCSTSQENHLNELSLFGMTAKQGYTLNNKEANLAIDGDISTFSISKSLGDNPVGWWEVDLGGIYIIGEIIITASKDDTYTYFLQSFDIRLLNTKREQTKCSSHYTTARPFTLQTLFFKCDETPPTRHVKIVRTGKNYVDSIAIAEVKVITRNRALENLINVLDVSQSNTWDDRSASLAIDGNEKTFSLSAWFEEQYDRGWWQIKFTQSYQIREVIITASHDQNNAIYLQFFSIWLIDEDETIHLCYKYASKKSLKAKETRSFPCQNNQLLANRVRIARDGGHRQDALALAEVQIKTIKC